MPPVITFASQKGGVGKTSIAVGVAAILGATLADTNKWCVIVDLDPQAHTTLALGAGGATTPTIGETLTRWASDTPAHIADTVVDTELPGVRIIPARRADLEVGETSIGRRPDKLDALTELVADLPADTGFVVVDTRPDLGPLTQTAVAAATSGGVVGVTRAQDLDVAGVLTLHATWQQIAKTRPAPPRWLGTAVNDWNTRRKDPPYVYAEMVARGLDPFRTVIPSRVDVASLTHITTKVSGYRVDADGRVEHPVGDAFHALTSEIIDTMTGG